MDVNTALIALVGFVLLVGHLRRADCDERTRAAVNEARRDALHAYRQAYSAGLHEGYNDGFDYYARDGVEEEQTDA